MLPGRRLSRVDVWDMKNTMKMFSVPHTPREYYRVAVSVFFFILGLVFSSWAGRIPDVKSALRLNDAQLGTALFAIPLGAVAALTFAGVLVDRFGSRRTLLLALALYPLLLVCIGLAGSLWQLFAVLLCFGMAGNIGNIAVNTQAVGVERLYRRSIMASFHGLWSLAGVGGGVAGAGVANRGMTPEAHFCAVLAVALGLLLAMRRWLLPREVTLGRPASPERKTFVRPDLYLVLLGIIGFGSMGAEGAMYDWSSVYFASEVRPPEAWIRLGYIACMCAMVCGRFTADGMVNRYGVIPVLQISGACIAVGLALALVFPSLVPATAGFALVGFGMASVVPLCYSLSGKSRRATPGMALTLVSSISFFGFLFCPPVIGFLSHALDLRRALTPVVGFGLIIAFLAPLLRRYRA